MTNLLALSTATIIGIAVGVVLLIVEMVLGYKVNRHFRFNYHIDLIGGCMLMILAIGLIVGGVLLVSKMSNFLGYVLMGIGAVIILGTLIFDCMRCGVPGFLALVCQIFLCVGFIGMLFDVIFDRTVGFTGYDVEGSLGNPGTVHERHDLLGTSGSDRHPLDW